MQKLNSIIYQIFVRNYSKQGTFKKVEKDLPRLRRLGVDIIYLMPIHEIGVVERKGTYGSPYAIKDYFSISSDLGTLEDFQDLVKAVHKNKMRIILDMVFNHTSPDNVLIEEHPEYYYYTKKGQRGNRVGDWTDIVDLNTGKKETQDYLLKVLKYWRGLDVDGFRFDVASMIPLSFFKRARKALGKKVIFIGESVDEGFVAYLKKHNVKSTPDKDMFPTFDALYNYNWLGDLYNYIQKGDYQTLINKLIKQEEELPKNAFRINCLDNHDQERIAKLAQNPKKLKNILDFVYFLKGNAFIYMGDEFGNKHKPELFEKDPVDWDYVNKDLEELYINLIKEKSNDFNNKIVKQSFEYMQGNKVAVTLTNNKGDKKVRVFDFN